MTTPLSSYANRALLVVGGGLVAAILLTHSTFYDRLNWWVEDAQQRLLAQPLEFRNTLTVDVDEASMALLEPELGPWPYARDVYARTARFLLDSGAKAVVFDILLSEARRGDPELARESGPKVVFGAAALPLGLARSVEYHERLERLSMRAKSPMPARTWDDLTLPLASFTDGGARVGVISFSPDGDGTLRRASLLHTAHGRTFPSLALAAIMVEDGSSAEPQEGMLRAGSRAWPINANGEAVLRFPASMAPMEVVPFHAVMQWIGSAATPRNLLDLVRGRIVFVGSSSAVLGDFVYTPVGRLPGLHATALSAELLLEGKVMRPPRIAIDITLLFVALAIPVVMIRRESTLRPLGFLALIVVSVLATAALGLVLNASGQQAHWVFASLTACTSGLLALVARIFALHHERQRLYYEARAANEASRLKTEFLNRMTHELRTPITAISGFNKINRFTDNLGRDSRISNSDIISRNCDHMLALINDNLDIARIEAGALSIERKEEDVRALFADTVASLQPLAREKGFGINLVWKGALPRLLLLDALRTRQILINLLGNAIKFTDRGEVGVKVSWQDDVLHFRVLDRAGGIPSEIRERLFTPFQRVAGSRKPGTGLGLAITKNLVDLMGGSIGVETMPGVGSTFRVRIPAWSVVENQPAAAPEAAPEPAPEAAPEPASARLQGRVLVAEDNADIRYLLKRMLELIGVEYKLEKNGFAALETALAADFDLVLLDLEMPVMDGFEAVHVMRERGYVRPIVAMTAHMEGPATERARLEGFDAVIAKPFRVEDMEQALRQFLVPIAAAGERARLEPRIPELLMRNYLARCGADSAELREALASERYDVVLQIAHRMRGGGGFFGFDEITRLGGAIESAAQARESASIAALAAELQLCIDTEIARRSGGSIPQGA